MKHKTVLIDDIEIDEKIAPLIKKLWELGIETLNSCENNVPEEWIWIEFKDSNNLEKFLNIIAEYSEDRNSLYNRIRQAWDSDNDSLFWKYTVHPNDYGVEEYLVDDEIEEEFTGESNFVFSVSVRFPQSDLENIMMRLNNYEN